MQIMCCGGREKPAEVLRRESRIRTFGTRLAVSTQMAFPLLQRRFCRHWLVVLAAAWAPTGLCAASEVGRPIGQAYTPRMYRADAQNFCAAQDRYGVMYFGNTNGVLTYDGAEWRVVKTGYSENIRGMAVGADGNVYLGGTRQIGYVRVNGLERTYVSLADQLPPGEHDSSVFSRVEAHGDAVYFATERFCLIWRAGRFTLLPVDNPAQGPIELHAVGGELFVNAARQPLRRIRAGVLETVSEHVFFRENAVAAIEAIEDGLLLATARQGLFRWDGRSDRFVPYPTEVDALLRTNGIYRARRLRDGSLALMLANQGGTVFVDAGGRFRWRLDDSAGLPSRVVLDVEPDRQGGLWLCLTDGLARLEWPSAFSFFERGQGLNGRPWAITRHEGVLHVGAHDGLYRLNAGTAERGPARFEQITQAGAAALLSDPNGLIVAQPGGRVVQLGKDGPVTVFAELGPVSVMLRSTRDPNRIFLAGAGGVASMYWREGAWRSEGKIQGLPTGSRTLAELSDGSLWTATMADGAYRVRFGAATAAEPRGLAEVKHFNVGTHGLPAKRNTMRVYNWADSVMLVQGAGGVWVMEPAAEQFRPAAQAGLALPHPGDIALFLSAQFDGHVWVQRDTNVPEELAIYRVAKEGAVQALPHTIADAPHFARVLWEERFPDGNVLWVGGNDGLLRVEVARAFASPVEFATLVSAARVEAGTAPGAEAGASPAVRPVELPEGARVSYGPASYAFEAVAPVFGAGGGARYQSRLEGFEPAWSDWSPERKRVFTNLGPGRYTYHVRASDNDGRVGAVVTRSFTILPPWWQTPWAIGLLSLTGIGGVAGVTRWFANRALKRRVARLESEQAVQRERLRLARDLHDEVGSGLGRVILFAGEAKRHQADPERLGQALDRVRNTAHELVEHAREIVWAVSPKHDTLASTIERLSEGTEQTLRAAGIACRVELPEPVPELAVPSEMRHNVFLALKEAVHNAVKYSDARSAELSIAVLQAGGKCEEASRPQSHRCGSVDGLELVVRLRDHGRGFSTGERRGSGHGLANVQARAAALGGRADIVSTPGQGTTVTLRCPLPGERTSP